MKILLISDIHGNFEALKAIDDAFTEPFDLILNNGDTTVYGPFPNETIDWLRARHVPSILGNTDRLILKLLQGRSFRKPQKAEKRIMYGWTAAELDKKNIRWLKEQPRSRIIKTKDPKSERTHSLAMFHGSPANPDELLFATTPLSRFKELAALASCPLITMGHSHCPFHRYVDGVHFINPGSVGRMFDGSPRGACAVLTLENERVDVELVRISYNVEAVVTELKRLHLPPIYGDMYRLGRKLN